MYALHTLRFPALDTTNYGYLGGDALFVLLKTGSNRVDLASIALSPT